MRKVFEKHIGEILRNEGGYVNDPIDTGGETNYGISKKAYPQLDIKNLTVLEAKEIYYKDYWVKAKCNDLPDHLGLIHFDTAVNSGISRAAKILQKASGVTADGQIGQITIQAAGNTSLAEYAMERALFYAKIVRHNKSQIKFLVGWMKRLRSVVQM